MMKNISVFNSVVILLTAASGISALNKKCRVKNNIDMHIQAIVPEILSYTQQQMIQSDGPITVPDPILAVGNDRIIMCVNSSIAIYNKDSLEQIGVFSMVDDIWTPAQFPRNADLKLLTDPWIVWDEISQRFWIAAFNPISAFGGFTQTDIYLAVSKSSTPNGPEDFYLYDILVEGLPDFLKIAVDENALYFSDTFFSLGTGPTDIPQQLRAFKKTPLLTGGAAEEIFNEFIPSGAGGTREFLGPVQPRYDNYGKIGPALFVQAILNDPLSGNTLRIHWIDTINSNPQRKFADVTVSHFARRVPTGIPQKPPVINPFNQPLLLLENAVALGTITGVADGDSLWVTHTVLSDDGQRFVARWYQFDISRLLSHQEISLVQEGNVDDGVKELFYPAINVDKYGNMAIAFSYAGKLNYAAFGYTGRLKNDPKGTVRMPIQRVAGDDLYYQSTQLTLSATRNRYGDYNGLAVDPSHKTFYAFVEDPQAVMPSITPQGFVGAITPFGAAAANTLAVFQITKCTGESTNAPQKEHLLKSGFKPSTQELTEDELELIRKESRPRFSPS